MTKTTITNNIPQLRFSEFDNKWEQQELGDKSTFSKGKNISKKDIIDDGIHLCIRYGELYTTYNEIIKKDKVVSKTNLDIKNLVLSKKNDVIIPSSGETQLDIATASCVIDSDIILGGDLNIIRTKHNGIFIAYYLNNKKKKDIAKLSQGNSVVHLYNKNLSKLNVNIPSALEQQKIANFLTQVDRKIELLDKQQAALEQYKKGVMQKIFKQEIRFKIKNKAGELVEPPGWEEKKLGEIFFSKKGKGISKSQLDDNGQYNCILYGELYTTYNEVISTIKSKTDFDDGILSKENDLLIPSSTTTTGIDLANVTALDIPKIRLGGDIIILRSNQKINNVFYAYYLSNHKRLDIARRAQGITIVHLYFSSIESIKIDLPSLDEQNKIANFLSAIDTKIEAVVERSQSHRKWKKGLLQKMFV